MGQHAHLYKTKTWHRLRYHHLMAEPLCRLCQQLGRAVAATIVDHVIPHRGDLALFNDPSNLAALCKTCHDRHKQRQEKSGYMAGGDTDGNPTDPGHHWNRP